MSLGNNSFEGSAIDFSVNYLRRIDGTTLAAPLHSLTEQEPIGAINQTGSINKLCFYPVVIPRTTTITQLSINVTTAVASSQSRIGIYNADPKTYLPTSLIFDSGVLDCSTTGVKSVACNITLLKGLYLACYVNGGGATAPAVTGSQTANIFPVYGSSNTGTVQAGFTVTFTFAALPATAPTVTGYLVGNVDTVKILALISNLA